MGRARRTLTDDGAAEVIYHLGASSPPVTYQQPANIRKTARIYDQYELASLLTIDPPDFFARARRTGLNESAFHPTNQVGHTRGEPRRRRAV